MRATSWVTSPTIRYPANHVPLPTPNHPLNREATKPRNSSSVKYYIIKSLLFNKIDLFAIIANNRKHRKRRKGRNRPWVELSYPRHVDYYSILGIMRFGWLGLLFPFYAKAAYQDMEWTILQSTLWRLSHGN